MTLTAKEKWVHYFSLISVFGFVEHIPRDELIELADRIRHERCRHLSREEADSIIKLSLNRLKKMKILNFHLWKKTMDKIKPEIIKSVEKLVHGKFLCIIANDFMQASKQGKPFMEYIEKDDHSTFQFIEKKNENSISIDQFKMILSSLGIKPESLTLTIKTQIFQ